MVRNLKYIGLFGAVQLAQLPLMIIGVPLIAVMAALKRYRWKAFPDEKNSRIGVWHWNDRWMWCWDNDQDGIAQYCIVYVPRIWWEIVKWSAFRNSVHNFGLIGWVNGRGKNRPLWYWFTGKHYFKAGWMSNGYPCLSFGVGRGY